MIDEKLIAKYRVGISEATRSRRKKLGYANLQYLRFERFFVIFATKGDHRFFEEERDSIRDIRRIPLRFAGYSISYRRGGRTRGGDADPHWHAHGEIERRQFLELKLSLVQLLRPCKAGNKMLDRSPRRSDSNCRDRIGGGSVNIAVRRGSVA